MSNNTNNIHLTGRVSHFNIVKMFITAFLVSTVANAQSETANPVDGGQIYNTYCAICHKLGLNAAPKYGNKILWGKVVKQGRETVYGHTLNGLRGMPPRGGHASLSDEEVKAGVDYMVRVSGGWDETK